MFDHKHYVPMLRARLGELGALAEASGDVRAAMTPLLSIPALPWDFETDAPAKSIDQHIPGFAAKIHKAWKTGRVFIDLAEVDGEIFPDGRHPATVFFDEAATAGLVSVPVVGLQRSPRYTESVRTVINQQGRGACIRVENSDLENPGALSSGLNGLTTYLGLHRGDCDLIFDLKAVTPDTRGPVVFALNTILSLLPGIEEWRTVTVTASAFPESMMNIPPHTLYQVPRVEWELWTSIASRGGLPRIPTFGDYAISHPSPASDGIDPRIMRMSANLRYTLDRSWLMLKGRNVRDHGFEQFNELCRMLVNSDGLFMGADYSWGDAYIDRAAQGTDGPGNATKWRQVGTSHHLAVVTKQIASLLG